MQIIQYCINI